MGSIQLGGTYDGITLTVDDSVDTYSHSALVRKSGTVAMWTSGRHWSYDEPIDNAGVVVHLTRTDWVNVTNTIDTARNLACIRVWK